MRDNNNFNGPGTGLDQRLGINERPIDLLSYNAGLYRAMNKKAGNDAQEENNPQPGPGDDKNWFYVEDVSGLGNTLIIRLNFEADPSEITATYDFYVSKDKESWTKLDTLNSTSKTVMYEFGECEKVYLRCSASFFYDNIWYGVCINCINSYNIGGNIMSLLYGSDFTGNEVEFPNMESSFIFDGLFYNSETLISAENLILPATTLANSCYYSMFGGCTSLTEAPQLPSTTLVEYCYNNMFSGCTSLTEAPQLPATTLAEGCYSGMFYGCTSLTEAPELPAITLTYQCYSNMFGNCTSLTSAPELPAITLAEECYSNMFTGCTSLTEAPELPSTELAEYCYQGMFSDCTSLTEAPQLPATELAYFCYNNMFGDCTLLTTAPQLPATTLSDYCYSNMFSGCTSLESVIIRIEGEWNTENTSSWLSGVAQSGTIYNLGHATNIPTNNQSGCPEGWIIKTELPQE